MSVRWSTGWPRACSGDMYATVPRMTPVPVRAPEPCGVSATVASSLARNGAVCRSTNFELPGVENVPQALPVDVLHRQEVPAVGRADVVDGDDVRVVQSRGRLR